MAKRTKKVGPAGRYGSRYGVRARSQVRNVELVQRKKHICPSCGHQKVKRHDTSIWHCSKCGIKFAGGAYYPRTEAGQGVEKALRGEINKTSETFVEAPVEEKTKKDKGEK